MKLLVRCINGYHSLEKVGKLYKMIKRHNKLFQLLEVKDKLAKTQKRKSGLNDAFASKKVKKQSKEKTAEMEAKVAYFCMHACRVYSMIISFLNDSLHVVNQQQSVRKLCVMTQTPEEVDQQVFLYNGSDYLERLIEDVRSTKTVY